MSISNQNRTVQITEILLAIETHDNDQLRDQLQNKVVQLDQHILSQALCYAVRQKHMQAVRLLLDHGGSPLTKYNCRTPLYWSVIDDSCNVLKELLFDIVPMVQKTDYLLHQERIPNLATNCKNEGFRSTEERHRARAKKAIDEALFDAASVASVSCVQYLLEIGADPNAYQYHDDELVSWCTPLTAATFASNPHVNKEKQAIDTVVETLVTSGADTALVNYLGDSCLHWAVLGGLFDSVNILLRYGCNVDITNCYDKTPLISLAASAENFSWDAVTMAKLLHKWGANLHAVDKDLWNALFYAVGNENYDLTVYFLENGVKPDISFIISEDNKTIVREVAFGETVIEPEVRITDPGVSALSIASYAGNMHLFKLLIKWNADVNPSFHNPRYHKNIMTHMITDGHYDMLCVLLEAGASRISLQEAKTCLTNSIVQEKDELFVSEFLRKVGSPHSLKLCCRTVIRQCMKPGAPPSVFSQLPVPKSVVSYIDFSDL